LNPNIHFFRSFQKKYKLRQRTFKNKEDTNTFYDGIKIIL